MIKLLFVLISVISNFSYGNQDYNLLMYKLDYNYTIVGEVSNYLLVNENGYKMIGTNDYEYNFDGLVNCQIQEVNNQIYVFGFKDNKLFVNIFTKYGMFMEEKLLVNNSIDNYQINYFNNKFLIIGNIKSYQDAYLNIEAKNKGLARNDIIVYEFANDFTEINHNLIGGKLNESVIDIVTCEGSVFLIGRKDKETGGDLGYGGIDSNSVFIARIDANLEISNYIVLDKQIIFESFYDYNNNLYLSTSTNLYCISKDLEFISNMKYLEVILYSHLTEDNQLITFSRTKGYVYDINKMEMTDSFNYPQEFDVDEINFFQQLDNYILCEYDDYLVLLDIIMMKDTTISSIYTIDREVIDVSSIFGKCNLIEKEEEYYFDPLVCGEYPFLYLMESKSGLEFSFETTQIIALETNVIENGVYPFGYNLRFTGKAYLNEKIIINNYPLNVAGKYKMVLFDNKNHEKIINFTVSEFQRQVVDFYQDYYQYEIDKGDSLELNFIVENIEDEFIGLYVNDKLYDITKINEDESIISVKVNDFKELGYHSFHIGSLIYRRDEIVYEDDINKYYYVKVNPLAPSFNLSVNDDGSLIVEADDLDNSIRSIRLYLYNNSLEYYFDYPVHTGGITINNVNIDETYNFSITIGYFTGGEITYTSEIISGKIQIKNAQVILGNINLLNNYETVTKFSLKINDLILNQELQQLSYLNNEVFLNSEFSYLPVIIFSLVVGTVGLGVVLFFRRKRLNKFN